MTTTQWLTSTDPVAMFSAMGEQADERRCKILVEECRKKWDITGKREWNQDVFRWRVVAKANWINQSVADRTNDWMAGIMRCIWPPPMMERERCPNCKGLGSIEAMDSICQLAKCKKCNGTGDAPLINPRWRTPLVTDLAGKARGGESKHTVAGGGDYRYAPNTELMPILADALMDQGCDNEIITDHLRHPHHVPGECWVVGMLLGTARESTIISSR